MQCSNDDAIRRSCILTVCNSAHNSMREDDFLDVSLMQHRPKTSNMAAVTTACMHEVQ